MLERPSEHLEFSFPVPFPLVEPKTEQFLRGLYDAAEQVNFGGLTLDETKALLDAQAGARERATASIGPVQKPTAGRVHKEEKTRYLISRAWKEAYSYAVAADQNLGYGIAMAMANHEKSIPLSASPRLPLTKAVTKYAAAHMLAMYCAEAFNIVKRPDEDALEVDMQKTQFSARQLAEDRFDRAMAVQSRVLETPHIRLLYDIFVIDHLGKILEIFAPEAANNFGPEAYEANDLCQEASQELQARLQDIENILKTYPGQIHNFAALTDILKRVVDRVRQGGTLITSLRAILSEKMDDQFNLDVDALSEYADRVCLALGMEALDVASSPIVGVLLRLRERMCSLLTRWFLRG